MKFSIEQVFAKDWIGKFSEDAYRASFGELRDSSLERFDFSIMAIDENNNISGFITCKEMDSETLYWQHGGTFKNYAKTIHVIGGYREFLNWAKERYKRVTTRIENINHSMLKMALAVGFTIIGTCVVNNKIYLELVNEFMEVL